MKGLLVASLFAIAIVTGGSAFASGEIRGKGGKCIDIPDGNTKAGTRLHYWPCDKSPEQSWTFTNGTLVGKDGMCMNVSGGQPADRAALQLSACSAPGANQWQLSGAQIKMGNKCLDLPDGNTRDGAPIHLWSCDSSPEQVWRYANLIDARANAENALGRVMGVLIYAQECKVSVEQAQIEKLGSHAERLQAKLAIPNADMDRIDADIRKDASSRCELVRSRFAEIYSTTLGIAESVP